MSEKPKADQKPSETQANESPKGPKARPRTDAQKAGPERSLTTAQLRRANIPTLEVQAAEATKGLDAVKDLGEDDPRRTRADRAAKRTRERVEEARKLQGKKR